MKIPPPSIYLPDPYRTDLRTHLGLFEGCIPWMYLDAGRIRSVTCGIGHRIATAGDASYIAWDGGIGVVAAAPGEWQAVMAATRFVTAAEFETVTTLRLSDTAMDALLDKDIAQKGIELAAALPEVAGWPPCVIQAMFDFGFNVGVARIVEPAPNGWPRMLAALRAGDWKTAALESHRDGIQAARNEYTANLILAAAA